MDYFLAKELADAGFPQVGKGGHVGPPDKLVWRGGDRVYCPTLSELIEACGIDVGVFVFADKTQGANAWYQHADPDELPIFHGATPDIAVARLWLALNKRG